MADDYEIGYGKPPKHGRFKKGRSGNPKGRPKGNRDFSTDLLETLRAPVQLTEKGRPKTVSTQQAALLRLREKALGGNARALDRLIDLARLHNDEDLAEAVSETLAPSDQAILETYAARLRRRDQQQRIANERSSSESGRQEENDDD